MTWNSLPAQVTYTDSRLRYIQSAVHARNPVIADMFTQLDYMEKRGSPSGTTFLPSAIFESGGQLVEKS